MKSGGHMRLRFLFLVMLVNFFCSKSGVCIEIPFNRGVNLTNWLQSKGPREIHFTRFGIDDLRDIRELGFDVIRLPINLHSMTQDSSDYSLDPLFLFFLDQIIDWCEELGLYVILDNHSFGNDFRSNIGIDKVLIRVWSQLARHLNDRSDFVFYEILNEPYGVDDLVWGRIQGDVIDTIRSVDEDRVVVVGPANWNSFKNLSLMPQYSDNRLIYTFHFYEPFLFTHQGANWVTPSMVSVEDIPFPYNSESMPRVSSELAGTWVGAAYSGYYREGNLLHIEEQLDIAMEFAKIRDVPIFCGEFGVFNKNAPRYDRNEWYRVVRKAFEVRGIPWIMWDYKGGFGLFERGSNELYDHDLNVELLENLGLTVPPQSSLEHVPLQEGIVLYSDFVSDNINVSNWSTGSVDFFSDNDPAFGDYCIRWSEAEQYNHIRFDFIPDINLDLLVEKGYSISFWVKGSEQISSFDIRFLNSENDQLPWRMRTIIDSTKVIWNDVWQEVRIPLSTFVEHGAWSGDWFEPQGLFDWSTVDCLEIVAEHHSFKRSNLYIDDLMLVSARETSINYIQEGIFSNDLQENIPNPFNSSTLIRYSVGSPSFVLLQIFNALGQKVCTLVSEDKPTGQYQAIWNGLDDYGRGVSTGLYFYQLELRNYRGAGKMILLR